MKDTLVLSGMVVKVNNTINPKENMMEMVGRNGITKKHVEDRRPNALGRVREKLGLLPNGKIGWLLQHLVGEKIVVHFVDEFEPENRVQ